MPTDLFDFLELCPDDVVVETLVSVDQQGARTYGGASNTYKAHITGRQRLIRTWDGQQRISTVQATLRTTAVVQVVDRFTLPARFIPNQPPAMAILRSADEAGPHHTTVFF